MNIAQYLMHLGLTFNSLRGPRTVLMLEDVPTKIGADDLDDPTEVLKFHLETLDLRRSVIVDDSDLTVVAALLENTSAVCLDELHAIKSLADLKYFGPFVVIKPGQPSSRGRDDGGKIIADISTPCLTRSELLIQVTSDVVRMVQLPDGKVVPQVRTSQNGHTGIAIVRRFPT